MFNLCTGRACCQILDLSTPADHSMLFLAQRSPVILRPSLPPKQMSQSCLRCSRRVIENALKATVTPARRVDLHNKLRKAAELHEGDQEVQLQEVVKILLTFVKWFMGKVAGKVQALLVDLLTSQMKDLHSRLGEGMPSKSTCRAHTNVNLRIFKPFGVLVADSEGENGEQRARILEANDEVSKTQLMLEQLEAPPGVSPDS